MPAALVRNIKQLRVAAVIDTWAVSGPGRQLAALATGLREKGVHLRIYMFQRAGRAPSPYRSYLEDEGVDHVVVEDSGPYDLMVLARLRSRLLQWRPHLVQSHGYRPAAFAFLLSRRPQEWAWIAFFHGDTNENWKVRFYNNMNRVMIPQADRIVLVAGRQRTLFSGSSDRCRVIHNACLPVPERGVPVSIPSQSGAPIVGVIARLSPEKGVDVLIDAAAVCRAKGTPISVLVAGDGPEMARLVARSKALDLCHSIHFCGMVENMPSVYRAVDLVVLPSRSEGLPNVLLEALGADVPVVATDVGAVREVLSDISAGVVVPPNNPTELANGILVALASGRSEAAHAARQAASERFSLLTRVAQHVSLYAELVPMCMIKVPEGHG